MAKSLMLFLMFFCAAVDGGLSLEDTQPVSDGFEEHFVEVIGERPNAWHFSRFAYENGKQYKTEAEMKQAFENFAENLKFIRVNNMKRLPYTLGINKFADWTWEEFKGNMLCVSQNCSSTEAVVPRETDQRSCGSCWVYSTAAALTEAYSRYNREKKIYSEQQIVDCTSRLYTVNNNLCCNSGSPFQAFQNIENKDVCRFPPQNVAIRVIDSVQITSVDENYLAHLLNEKGPIISLMISVGETFMHYSRGVYNDASSCDGDVNLAVLLVGSGKDPLTGTEYWIIKNGWGNSWGENGFMRLKKGMNKCNMVASYPVVG